MDLESAVLQSQASFADRRPLSAGRAQESLGVLRCGGIGAGSCRNVHIQLSMLVARLSGNRDAIVRLRMVKGGYRLDRLVHMQ